MFFYFILFVLFSQKTSQIVSIAFIYLQDLSLRKALTVTMLHTEVLHGRFEREKQNGIFNTQEEYEGSREGIVNKYKLPFIRPLNNRIYLFPCIILFFLT